MSKLVIEFAGVRCEATISDEAFARACKDPEWLGVLIGREMGAAVARHLAEFERDMVAGCPT
jgi:hypothetical protein